MQVQFLNAPEFQIDSQGILQRSGSWLLCAEAGDPEISQMAMEWAGSVGDHWREPNTAGDGFTLNTDLQITKISCQALDSSCCTIKFTGSPADSTGSAPGGNEPQIIRTQYRFERKKDLSEYKTAEFSIPAGFNFTLPAAGDMIDWAGENFRCESVTETVKTDQSRLITITAVNTAVALNGAISSCIKTDSCEIKSGVWKVLPEALDDFLSGNALYAPASWAGENFYISEVKTSPADSAQQTLVSLQARKSSLQMLEALRSEEIVAMNDFITEKSYVWQSRWRAHAEDRSIFANMLGTSAETWAESGMVVSKIIPRKISDCEFEYTLEARTPESIGSNGKAHFLDRDLPDRLEYYTRIGEMRLSPLQCGYTWRGGNSYRAIPNWQYIDLCPLEALTQLPPNWINQPIKLLEIVEVSYRRGISSENIADIAEWFRSDRVEEMTIIGITGSFLRYDLDIDDVTDSRHRQWTRIKKIYRQSPAAYIWNSNYWI